MSRKPNPAAERFAAKDPLPASFTTQGLALIVDDDVRVRRTMTKGIRSLGWLTVDADNAHDALALLDHGLEVDLLITDVKMPGALDGVDLAFAVRKRFPATQIIVISADFVPGGPDTLPADAAFIRKPCRLSTFAALLSERSRKC